MESKYKNTTDHPVDISTDGKVLGGGEVAVLDDTDSVAQTAIESGAVVPVSVAEPRNTAPRTETRKEG